MLEKTRTVVCSEQGAAALRRVAAAGRRADRLRPHPRAGRARAPARSPRPAGEERVSAAVLDSAVCVFDLDHTLVNSPLDLRAVGREMEAFVRRRGVRVAASASSAGRRPNCSRSSAARPPHLEPEIIAIPVAHERRAMEEAVARALRRRRRWRPSSSSASPPRSGPTTTASSPISCSSRFDLLAHLDLVVTRDDVVRLKPDPDGLRVVRARWPDAARIVVVGDSWVDGVAAQAGGVPFIAYRGGRRRARSPRRDAGRPHLVAPRPARRARLGACRRNHAGPKKWDGRLTNGPFGARYCELHRRKSPQSGILGSPNARIWHFSDTLLAGCSSQAHLRECGALGCRASSGARRRDRRWSSAGA